GMRSHAGADHRDFADPFLVLHARPQLSGKRPQDRQRRWQLVAEHRETDRGPAIDADALGNHVYDDVLGGHSRENAMADARRRRPRRLTWGKALDSARVS